MDVRRSVQRLAARTPAPLRRFITSTLFPRGFGSWLYPPAAPLARALEAKLWGGFSRYALRDLESLRHSRGAHPTEISHAAWSLARWYAAEKDYDRAYENVVIMRLANPEAKVDTAQALLEADCLIRLGEREAARSLLKEVMESKPEDPNLHLAMANTYAPLESAGKPHDENERLAWINRTFELANLVPITKVDPAGPLALDNLTGARLCTSHIGDTPKVSVIMPVYNAEATLQFALRSVLEQSWQNLEVIVVDDHSSDSSFAIAEDFARRDSRVRAVLQDRNCGAYSARNRGLELASGELIMAHDADDWSHPQRIERQVAHILANPIIGNLAPWVRTQSNLRFPINLWPWSTIVYPSHASLLFHRNVIVRNGGWDRVRVSGDTEFVWRLRTSWGRAKVTTIGDLAPLAFAREDESSLTRQSETHIRTIAHGVRRQYREAARHWHSQSELKIEPEPAERPFPAPPTILPGKSSATECDVLFVMDFNMRAGAFVSTMSYVEAALRYNYSVALFHWRRYDLNIASPLKSEIRQMAQTGQVRIVAPGERVKASTVVVGYPVILKHVIDLFPEIEYERLVVIINQMAARLIDGSDPQYDPREIREKLKYLFGSEGVWVPISGRVRHMMRRDSRYPPPHFEDWIPLIDTESWCAQPLRWQGNKRKRPVLGRHSRDHYTKWPASAEALREAYCADKPCDVLIKGGGRCAFEIIGYQPKNWSVHDFGSFDVRDFLSNLDFFIHYPHERYVEEFGRSVIEAMSLGIPAILPPVFRETFGHSALYAEPQEVWNIAASVWKDRALYLARAQAGRDFVRANCGFERFPARLSLLHQIRLAKPTSDRRVTENAPHSVC